MKFRTVDLYAIVGISALLICIAGMSQQKHLREQKEKEEITHFLTSLGKLKPGMTEGQVASILGKKYGQNGFDASNGFGDGLVPRYHYTDLPTIPPEYFRFEFTSAPAPKNNYSGYQDPATGKIYIRIFQNVRRSRVRF